MLYQAISMSLAKKLYAANHIRNEDQEVYAYCIEIILSTIVTLLSIFILSGIVHCVPQTIFFLIGFFSSRSLCGGYHANHHLTCYLISILNYVIFLLYQCFLQYTAYKQFVTYCMLSV